MNNENIATELQAKFKVYAPTTTEGATDIKYSVFYSLGGYNYFNGQQQRRGYYLSVQPVTRAEGNGYTSEQFSVFSGTKFFISPAELKRDSKKAATEARQNITAALIDELTGHVLAGAN